MANKDGRNALDQKLNQFGLHQGFSLMELKASFRERIKQYHPDHGSSGDREERERITRELIEAYEELLQSVGYNNAETPSGGDDTSAEEEAETPVYLPYHVTFVARVIEHKIMQSYRFRILMFLVPMVFLSSLMNLLLRGDDGSYGPYWLCLGVSLFLAKWPRQGISVILFVCDSVFYIAWAGLYVVVTFCSIIGLWFIVAIGSSYLLAMLLKMSYRLARGFFSYLGDILIDPVRDSFGSGSAFLVGVFSVVGIITLAALTFRFLFQIGRRVEDVTRDTWIGKINFQAIEDWFAYNKFSPLYLFGYIFHWVFKYAIPGKNIGRLLNRMIQKELFKSYGKF